MNSFTITHTRNLLKYTSISSKIIKTGLFNTSRFCFADPMKSKEFAEEKFFFDKEESNKNFHIKYFLILIEKTLEQLIKKLKIERSEDQEDEESFKSRERLKTLLDSYDIQFSKELMEDLVKWKRTDKH